MPTLTITYQSEEERLALEAAISFVSEMRSLAQAAPSGQVLSLCESLALDQGRNLLRCTLQQAVQSRIASAEQKGGRHAAAARARARSTSSAGTANATS